VQRAEGARLHRVHNDQIPKVKSSRDKSNENVHTTKLSKPKFIKKEKVAKIELIIQNIFCHVFSLIAQQINQFYCAFKAVNIISIDIIVGSI
jgi:hypothetical protein